MPDWSRVMELHGDAVWRIAWRLLGNEADAADCFQDTFLSALKVAQREPVRNWSALMKRLATARALDRLRRGIRHSQRQDDAVDISAVMDKHSDPVGETEWHELIEHLRDALEQLPAEQATVFYLRCLEDVDSKDVAEELGITTTRVRVQLHRARSKLQEFMKSWMSEARVEGSQ